MKNFLLLLIFSMLSAGVMLSGIAMKDFTASGVIMLLLCLVAIIYLRRNRRKSGRYRYPNH